MLSARLIAVSEALTRSASAMNFAPSTPTLLCIKLRPFSEPYQQDSVRIVARARDGLKAKLGKTWQTYFKLVSEALTRSASAMSLAPSSPIRLSYKLRPLSKPYQQDGVRKGGEGKETSNTKLGKTWQTYFKLVSEALTRRASAINLAPFAPSWFRAKLTYTQAYSQHQNAHVQRTGHVS